LALWLDKGLFTTIFYQIPIKPFSEAVLKDRSELVCYQLDAEAMASATLFMTATVTSEFSPAESILAEKT